ncbi:hypothetical protein EYR40_002258 [Pleurotus pulmonarius]|nr:hypothetical protein EYR40_002258 [Pleurotus pulmonarius]
MVFCIVCGVDGPWKAGTSLMLHQKQCRKKVHLARIKQMAEAGNPANNDDNAMQLMFMQVEPPPPLELQPPTAEPDLTAHGRPRHPKRRLPKRYRDNSTDIPPAVVVAEVPHSPEPILADEPVLAIPHEPYYTVPNASGLYKIYPNRPTRDPDGEISIDDLCDSPNLLRSMPPNRNAHPPEVPITGISGEAKEDTSHPWLPFFSITVACLMCWFYGGSNQKSVGELDTLVHNVILRDDFQKDDLLTFSTSRKTDRLDIGFDAEPTNQSNILTSAPLPPPTNTPADSTATGWKTESVKIRLPADKVKCPEDQAPEFKVKGVIHPPLLDVLKESFQGPAFEKFHLTPFEYCLDPDLNPGITSRHTWFF